MARKRSGAETRLALRFAELPEGEQPPAVEVHALDREGNTIHTAVAKEGNVTLPAKAVEGAHKVVVAAAGAGAEASDRMVIRSAELHELLQNEGVLEIPRSKWGSLIFRQQCVDGSVAHCIPFPWFLDDLASHAGIFEKLSLPKAPLTPFRPRCETICDGEVIVYRRTCCCGPIILLDPRLEDLIERLRELVAERPVIKWPPPPPPEGGPVLPPSPGPGPDPAPFSELPFFSGGTVSAARVFAARDLEQIERLEGQQLVEYVNAREYLRPFWCRCGAPAQVAVGRIRPDGTFHICWREPVVRLRPGCHDEYAFQVRQSVSGSTITIYDGLAANEWFDAATGIRLVTYDRRAVGCRDNTFPGSGAFVVLQDIGSTPSYLLKTPAQDAFDGVLTPTGNDGLYNPAPAMTSPKATMYDANWGGTLPLRYHFSEAMRTAGAGARYYRISVVAADAAGNPTGTRSYLGAPLSWLYFEIVGTDINVEAESLGPNIVGGEANLYRIPYDADHDWQSGQYHGFLDTAALPEGRYLVMLEVFDGAGNHLRPTGVPGPGNDTPFTFRRWFQPTGPTANVPFAALTHLFWWDNRTAHALLAGLRQDGTLSTDECQFMVGTGSSKVGVDFRAYHPEARFLYYWSLWWKRGLGGSTGTFSPVPPATTGDNQGVPPGAAATSQENTFSSMLGGHSRCTFAVNLNVYVKTWNGSGRLSGYDRSDQGSFALLT